MAINSELPVGVAESPDATVDIKTQIAVAPLHVGLHTLHRGISKLIGAWIPNPAEYSGITPATSVQTARMRKLYKQAAVAISAGQLIALDATGKVVLADATTMTAVIGYATTNCAALGWGEFILFEGMLNITGVVSGTLYYLSNSPGSVSAVPGTTPIKVGIGIATGILYVKINL
jgi:hypothetical protein